jgi:hypothetical protein
MLRLDVPRSGQATSLSIVRPRCLLTRRASGFAMVPKPASCNPFLKGIAPVDTREASGVEVTPRTSVASLTFVVCVAIE